MHATLRTGQKGTREETYGHVRQKGRRGRVTNFLVNKPGNGGKEKGSVPTATPISPLDKRKKSKSLEVSIPLRKKGRRIGKETKCSGISQEKWRATSGKQV